MAEKRGETEKLTYDFNTAGLLEVFVPKLDGWYRVTGREFRSFDGLRRITVPTECRLGTVQVPMETFEYWGPVFMFGTNQEMSYTNSGSMYTGKIWDSARETSEKRG
jgi:hypothetical protein